jgi:hypothetical protein
MITNRCAGVALLGGLLYLTIMMVYPDGWAALRLMAYVAAFNTLPGLALILLAAPGAFAPGVLLLLSWTFGLFVNLLVVTALWLCGGVKTANLEDIRPRQRKPSKLPNKRRTTMPMRAD